jgi:hypothetical protein
VSVVASLKKSPFRILIEQARDLGIKRLRFDVDVENYTEDDSRRWSAVMEPNTPISTDRRLFTGTNGQHALTELVAEKRFVVEQAERKK